MKIKLKQQKERLRQFKMNVKNMMELGCETIDTGRDLPIINETLSNYQSNDIANGSEMKCSQTTMEYTFGEAATHQQ